MGEKAINYRSGGLQLEGVLGCPEGASGPIPGVVLCHPGPTGGGNMNNNLVLSVYLALVEKGFASLRFNFRGVGNSEGVHAQGEKEPEDAEAALKVLTDRVDVDENRLGMAGYSFGSGVILRSLSRYASAKAFVLFSPALRHLDYPVFDEDPRPKLFVCGDRDHALPIASLKEKMDALKCAPAWRVVPGADHFWWGYEAQAARHAAEFFSETLS